MNSEADETEADAADAAHAADADTAEGDQKNTDKPSSAAAPQDNDEDMNVEAQTYVDRDNLDFDPDEGLLSGTAIDGTSDIPGPHENQDDVEPEGDSGDGEGGSEGAEGEGADAEDESEAATDGPDQGREDETEKAADDQR